VKDRAQALKWYTKAAERGYAIAQFNLGSIYRETNEHEKAMEWFLRAAKQGHPGSIKNVVELYLHGHCMKVDYRQAYYWLASTHRQDEWAMEARDECRKHLPEKEVEEMDGNSGLQVTAATR
jgi:TPR repeat protein